MTAVAVVGWAVALFCAAGWRVDRAFLRHALEMHDAALKGWHEANGRVEGLMAMVRAHRTPSPN